MHDDTSLKIGIAKVTPNGLIFNDNVYSSPSMLKSQWFQFADRDGEWELPVLYLTEESNHVFLFDQDKMEIASAVINEVKLSDEVLQAYYEALNNLKSRLKGNKKR
ncbi:hypothetical protein [Paenibacillus nasutitermitis]|uniref:Uncharacterized protein n=1 Tax=Paenibacillus nasutitermitis TaxID=1652958 RepID=A0A916YV27_9BACL|nr:hypothetical protein [Paenibacillus nasutitermitis]GGD62782.1 hypothetical protein GCM10010911_20660 [Paenibacillus nasutitermitis]